MKLLLFFSLILGVFPVYSNPLEYSIRVNTIDQSNKSEIRTRKIYPHRGGCIVGGPGWFDNYEVPETKYFRDFICRETMYCSFEDYIFFPFEPELMRTVFLFQDKIVNESFDKNLEFKYLILFSEIAFRFENNEISQEELNVEIDRFNKCIGTEERIPRGVWASIGSSPNIEKLLVMISDSFSDLSFKKKDLIISASKKIKKSSDYGLEFALNRSQYCRMPKERFERRLVVVPEDKKKFVDAYESKNGEKNRVFYQHLLESKDRGEFSSKENAKKRFLQRVLIQDFLTPVRL